MTLSTPDKIRSATRLDAQPRQTVDAADARESDDIKRTLISRDLRSTLGSFATGITIITARATDGEPIGLTISSFNSVSLDPPLILWSLSLISPKLEAFRSASHYAVNVLAADQRWLSDRFAARGKDRFGGLPQRAGLGGAPLIEGCCAWFECANEAQYPGGDHAIFVGRVERFAQGDAQSPLIFHNARYCQLAPQAGD
jgi:flavin reductase (DIM6/NTAB) family NADH-FMN oxidoreductase RutF